MIIATVAIITGITLAIIAGAALYRLPSRVIRMNPEFTRANRRKGKAKITDRQLQLLIDWTPISLAALERITGRTEVDLVERVQAQWDRNLTNKGE